MAKLFGSPSLGYVAVHGLCTDYESQKFWDIRFSIRAQQNLKIWTHLRRLKKLSDYEDVHRAESGQFVYSQVRAYSRCSHYGDVNLVEFTKKLYLMRPQAANFSYFNSSNLSAKFMANYFHPRRHFFKTIQVKSVLVGIY